MLMVESDLLVVNEFVLELFNLLEQDNKVKDELLSNLTAKCLRKFIAESSLRCDRELLQIGEKFLNYANFPSDGKLYWR